MKKSAKTHRSNGKNKAAKRAAAARKAELLKWDEQQRRTAEAAKRKALEPVIQRERAQYAAAEKEAAAMTTEQRRDLEAALGVKPGTMSGIPRWLLDHCFERSVDICAEVCVVRARNPTRLKLSEFKSDRAKAGFRSRAAHYWLKNQDVDRPESK